MAQLSTFPSNDVKLLTIMYKSQGGNSQYQHGSPHVPLKPSAKRSATPEHMLNDQVHNVTSFTIFFSSLSKLPPPTAPQSKCAKVGVEMRQLGPHSRVAHSPQVSASKVGSNPGP